MAWGRARSENKTENLHQCDTRQIDCLALLFFARKNEGKGDVVGIWFGPPSCGVVYAFGGMLIRFTTGTADPGIVGNAVMSLRWHFTFFPVLGCLLALKRLNEQDPRDEERTADMLRELFGSRIKPFGIN